MTDLTDRAALVTGANRGIRGRAIDGIGVVSRNRPARRR
jgi:hypothetical protein